MRSETSIANMACDWLSLDPIGDLQTDRGKPYLRRNYEEALETVLREFSWNCATMRAIAPVITEIADFQWDRTTYGAIYALPADYLRMIDINDRPCEEIFWTVETVQVTDANGTVVANRKVLLLQGDFWINDTVMLRYVGRIGADAMDAHCAKAVSLELAIRCVNKARNSGELLDRLQAMYKGATSGDGIRKGGHQISSRENNQLPPRVYSSTGGRARAGIL